MALTDKDLRAIGELILEKTGHLLSREEFLAFMDPVVGDLKTMRQEQTMSAGRLRDHEDRITSLEEIHPGGDHAH